MFRLSKLADYGTVVMVYLAKHPQFVCNARDIARHTHLALPTVSKILKRLTIAGLLTSIRGSLGGYQLQRSAQDISLAQIIKALEDYQGFTECSGGVNTCSLHAVCTIQDNWRFISKTIEQALSQVSLEILAKPIAGKEISKVQNIMSGGVRG